jgi:hypothetical protein
MSEQFLGGMCLPHHSLYIDWNCQIYQPYLGGHRGSPRDALRSVARAPSPASCHIAGITRPYLI